MDRVLLTNSPNFKIPPEKAEDEIVVFIHPVYAVIFSYFDGNTEYVEVLKKIAQDFSEDIETIKNIVEPFLENKDFIGFEYDGIFFEFPKKILVDIEAYKNDSRINRNYKPEEFYIEGDLDFFSPRLKTSPNDIRILVNTECATDCIYCYVDRRIQDTCKIPIERIVEVIEESKRLGVTSFDIAGSEIFLYKHWDVLVESLLKNNYYPYLSTKIPIGEKVINRLVELGIKDIQFSIDSLIEDEVKLVDKFNTKSYSTKILETLAWVEKVGLNVAVNTVITKHNCSIDGIAYMLNQLNVFKNIEVVTINIGETSAYKTEYEFTDFRVSLEQIMKIQEYITNNLKTFDFKLVMAGYTEKEEICGDFNTKNEKFKKRSMCTAGIRQICILPDGNITGCEELYWHPQFIMGNILKNSLEEIWQSERAINFNSLTRDSFSNDSICKTCINFEKCRMGAGICYSDVISAYGYDKWDYPSPECPKAPKPKYVTYFE